MNIVIACSIHLREISFKFGIAVCDCPRFCYFLALFQIYRQIDKAAERRRGHLGSAIGSCRYTVTPFFCCQDGISRVVGRRLVGPFATEASLSGGAGWASANLSWPCLLCIVVHSICALGMCEGAVGCAAISMLPCPLCDSAFCGSAARVWGFFPGG